MFLCNVVPTPTHLSPFLNSRLAPSAAPAPGRQAPSELRRWVGLVAAWAPWPWLEGWWWECGTLRAEATVFQCCCRERRGCGGEGGLGTGPLCIVWAWRRLVCGGGQLLPVCWELRSLQNPHWLQLLAT
jgi:hypothetical protein